MAKSRFSRSRSRPGRFFVYLLAGAFVLGVGGMAAEHGGPTFNGTLVAKSANKPAPPAPKPNNHNSSNLQTVAQSQATHTTVPPNGTIPPNSTCTTSKNGDHTKCTSSDGSVTKDAGGGCPAYGSTSNAHGNQVKCQKAPHNPQPTQCWWSQTEINNHNGDTKTEWKVYNDKDHGNGKNDPKQDKCEASGDAG